MPTRYHLAIRRPSDDRLLVLADGSMPGFSLDDAPPRGRSSRPVVDGAREALGLDVVALRAALDRPSDDPDFATPSDRSLYEAVWVGGALPSGTRWIAATSSSGARQRWARAIDAGALDPVAGDRQPWYRQGWLDECTGWIDAGLAAAGLRRHGRPRQVRSWSRSALLTVETDRGRVWAKQVPRAFAHEVAVTGLLADLDPGIVPPLLAADAATGRVLMEDIPGPGLDGVPTEDPAWPATMEPAGRDPTGPRGRHAAVRMAGVPLGSLDDLADAHPGAARRRRRAAGGSARRLDAARPLLCARPKPSSSMPVARSRLDPLGPSLDHGDLTPDQVIMGAMGPGLPRLVRRDADASVPGRGVLPVRSRGAGVTWYRSSSGPTSTGGRPPDRARTGLRHWSAPGWSIRCTWRASSSTGCCPGLEQPWEVEGTVPQLLGRLADRIIAGPLATRR